MGLRLGLHNLIFFFYYYTLVVLKIDTSFHNALFCSVRYCLSPFRNI